MTIILPGCLQKAIMIIHESEGGRLDQLDGSGEQTIRFRCFANGFGDGLYPVYFAYDAQEKSVDFIFIL